MGTFHKYFPPRPNLDGYEGGGGGEIKWVGYGDVKSIAAPLPSLSSTNNLQSQLSSIFDNR